MKEQFIAHIRKSDRKSQYLWKHLNGVSDLAGGFAEKIGLREAGEVIGLLHDLGKASREFQNYIKSAEGLIDPDQDEYVDALQKKGKVDHSSAGSQIIFRELSEKGPEGIIAAQVLSLCIASHHSGLIDCLTPDGENNFGRRMEKKEERTHTNEALSSLDEESIRKIDHLLSSGLEKHLHKKMKDMLESNDSKETMAFKCGLLTRFIFSCLIDADRIDTADFESPSNKTLRNKDKATDWEKLIARFNTKKFENKTKVDALRNQISQECLEFSKKPRGLYQLTVPTGGGKTFSSLRFALHHAKRHAMDRIIYVIPYTSIIDQNAEEVRKILEEKDKKGNVVLEHHSNLTPDEESKRQNLLSENWDAPIIFTTQVQFLEALYSSGTRGARRMHRLANAVIIFDEVQTVPVRCVHLFNLAARFLVGTCNSTVILCTATQPLLDKVEPMQRSLNIGREQQMIEDVKTLFKKLKRVSVQDKRKAGGWKESDVKRLIEKEIKVSLSVLIIVNTKASAQSLYQELKSVRSAKVYHLSTNMCPAHRMDILNEIKQRLGPQKSKPTICVSTQLIEAGVDIDFGSVIRYLAGLDSIAQAAGRCNRHGWRSMGNVYIVNPKDENLGKLEDIRKGIESTEHVLYEYSKNPKEFDDDILSPAAMERYYLYYFYERKEAMSYHVGSNSIVGRDDNLFDLLSTNTLSVQEYQRINGSTPNFPFRQSFQMASKAFRAIDSATQGIVVPFGKEGKEIINELCDAFDLEKQYRLLKKAQRYSVNVFPRTLDELFQKKAIYEVQEGTGVFYLDSQYYNEDIGLSKEIVNEMEFLNA